MVYWRMNCCNASEGGKLQSIWQGWRRVMGRCADLIFPVSQRKQRGKKNMFCSKCGKELAAQAKFCNYCGAPVNEPQPAAASQPVPQAQTEPQTASQEQPAKKKGKAGRSLVSILAAVVVYFVVRGVTENALTGGSKSSGTPQSAQETMVSADASAAMSSCMYGGLYQNGVFRYGMTKLTAPGYSLLPGGDERDWLLSGDGAYLLAAYRQSEITGVSYGASTEAVLLKSYKDSYGSAEMIDFRKMTVGGFPVIRYIVAYTDADVLVHEGGYVVFPAETAKETLRLALFADPASGGTDAGINRVLDTLQLSPAYALTYEDTKTMGLTRITVK